MHAYIHTYMHTHTHACMHTLIHKWQLILRDGQTWTCMYVYMYRRLNHTSRKISHAYIPIRMPVCVHACLCVCMCACLYASKHTQHVYIDLLIPCIITGTNKKRTFIDEYVYVQLHTRADSCSHRNIWIISMKNTCVKIYTHVSISMTNKCANIYTHVSSHVYTEKNMKKCPRTALIINTICVNYY